MIKLLKTTGLIIALTCLAEFCGAVVDVKFGTSITNAFYFIAGVICADIVRKL